MSGTIVETVHASDWHEVEGSIDSLHSHTLRSAADDIGRVRLAVLNIVAGCSDRAGDELATKVVTALGEDHPARAIVILANPDAEPAVEADVSLLRKSVGEYEVYTELIHLAINGGLALHLASVVTPLLVPDIPVDLWVVGAARLAQAFSEDAIELCSRIIVDSGAYPDARNTLQLLASQVNRDDLALVVADIAWERMRIWRELTAQAFDPPGARPLLWRITDVDLRSAGTAPSAQVWLLAGWLASRLNWRDDGVTHRLSADAKPVPGIAPGDLVYARYVARDGDRLARFAIARHEDAVHVSFEIDGTSVERTLPYREPDLVELLARLMDEAREDTIYPAALTRAATLAR